MKKQLRDSVDYKVLGKLELQNFALQKTAYVQGAQSCVHSHQNPRFVFILRGRFSEIYERKSRECFPFMTIFRPASEKHSEDYYGKGIVCLRIDISPVWLERLSQYNVKLAGSEDFYSDELIALIKKLNAELDNYDAFSALAIEAIMLETVISISRRDKKSFSKYKNPQWLLNAKDYIHAEFTAHLTVSEIAAATNIHPVHLARTFRRSYGYTIAEYVRRLRVDFACSALASSNESLAEIAVNAGFSDQSRFSKTFKRLTNLTPAEYRAAIHSR
jgi:AraC family transcriptional regulator